MRLSIANQRHVGHSAAVIALLFIYSIAFGPDLVAPRIARAQTAELPAAGSVDPSIAHIGGPLHVTRAGDKLYCGAAPVTEDHFAQLERLGIKTIVCVDAGAETERPSLDRGFRYAHIPITYGGPDRDQVRQLAYVMRHFPSPIYVHCHHGKHRAPAALAIGAVATGQLAKPAAKRILQMAGTDPEYEGLWGSVQKCPFISPDDMPGVIPTKVETVEIARVMGKMETHMAALEDILQKDSAHARSGELSPAGNVAQRESQPGGAFHEIAEGDLSPPARALLVQELLHELARQEPEELAELRAELKAAERAAAVLHESLRTRIGGSAAEALFSLRAKCDACHAKLK